MLQRGVNLCTRTDRPHRRTHRPSDLKVTTLRKRLDGIVRIEYHNDIGNVRTDLESPSDTGGRNTGWRRPRTVRQSSDHETRACFSRKHKSGLEDGEHGEALRSLDDLGGDLVEALDVAADVGGSLADLRSDFGAFDERLVVTRDREKVWAHPFAHAEVDPCRHFHLGSPPAPRPQVVPRIAPASQRLYQLLRVG